MKIGLLLVNLGTPKSPRPSDVYKYLIEFLTDERVIDFGWLKRQLLVRGIIVPLRFRQSAKLYQEIWTKEGSPLLVHSRDLQQKIQDQLSSNYVVELAMRYQQPSIDEALQRLQNSLVSQIIVLPLFPQYASATTGSVHKKIMQSVMDWPYIPKLTFINNFASYEGFINSICARASEHDLNSYDHILFSFHGLPQRQIKTADLSGNCLTNNCCNTLNIKNHCLNVLPA